MTTHDAGKGDTYRPVDRRKYYRGYLRLFGEECSVCLGSGELDNGLGTCPRCEGLGYVEKPK
jgi:DnaJ-class molecular chaperone